MLIFPTRVVHYDQVINLFNTLNMDDILHHLLIAYLSLGVGLEGLKSGTAVRQQYFTRRTDRSDRSDRSERSERSDRSDRSDRSEIR